MKMERKRRFKEKAPFLCDPCGYFFRAFRVFRSSSPCHLVATVFGLSFAFWREVRILPQ